MKNKIADIFKFVFFILLLPLVVTMTVNFMQQLEALPSEYIAYFIRGIAIYLFIHLFIYEPAGVYGYGQKVVGSIFKFFAPLVTVAPFFLPIYSLLLLMLFYFAQLFIKDDRVIYCFMFLVSFTLTMHLVFTAKSLREKDKNASKPNYFFALALIYTVNTFILALMFNLIFEDFSFPQFFLSTTRQAGHIYMSVFRQLFMP